MRMRIKFCLAAISATRYVEALWIPAEMGVAAVSLRVFSCPTDLGGIQLMAN